jgi:ubiquinone/menaquinone biosynthesis C-methylase UbiE
MNCDGIAAVYETLERISFGGALQRMRVAYLRQAGGARMALVCGDGDGRFLAELLRANRRVTVDYVDASARMTELAHERIARLGEKCLERVRFFTGDIRKFSAAENRYDLVTGHFFLDCFTDAELVGTIARIAEWSTPDACWLVSDFREAQTRMGRLWTQAMIRGLYAGFRMMTGLRVRRVPDYAAALAAYGYRLRAEEERLGGLLFSSVWERSARRGGSEERRG